MPAPLLSYHRKLLRKDSFLSAHFRDGIDQLFGILPSQAGIGDGFAVDVIVDSLISLFDIALDHDAFDQSPDVVGAGAAVEHFLYDADLLLELLVGVIVVGVYDAGGILQIPGAVKLKAKSCRRFS